MKTLRIETQAPRRGSAFAKHLACVVPLFVSAMPVISLLGTVWFLVIQPALH